MLHCPIRFHFQNTGWKIKLLRIRDGSCKALHQAWSPSGNRALGEWGLMPRKLAHRECKCGWYFELITTPVKIPSFKDVAVDLLLLAGMQVGKFLMWDKRIAGTRNMIASGFESKSTVIRNFLRELEAKRKISQSWTVSPTLDTPVSRPPAVLSGKFWLLDRESFWAYTSW